MAQPLQLQPNPKYTHKGADINTIPYDAPLSFLEPPSAWLNRNVRDRGDAKDQHSVSVPPADLTGKNVIISGGNNGIGREAALQMAAWGANLILACRNPPPHESHPNDVAAECKARAKAAGKVIDCEWWEVDMANLASIDKFTARWLATGKQLDILCNNAGMGASPGGSKVFKTKDGFEIVHQVNFLSHVLMTLSLLPSLAKAPEARVVFTTSCFHYLGIYDLTNWNGEKGGGRVDGVQFYQNAKLCLQIWLTELQRRLLLHPEYAHITCNGVHPGYVASGIWNFDAHGAVGRFIKAPVMKALAWTLGISPQQGSMAILHAATRIDCGADAEKQGGRRGGGGGGRYFNRVWEREPMPHTRDADARLRVWRKANDELELEKRGLLDVLGLKA